MGYETGQAFTSSKGQSIGFSRKGVGKPRLLVISHKNARIKKVAFIEKWLSLFFKITINK